MSEPEEGKGPNGSENGQAPSRRLSGFASPEYWDEERREKQREWARKAHAEGRFGGPGMGQGRKKQKTATELIAEKAADDAALIYRNLKEMLSSNQPSIRLRAIQEILKAEQKVEESRLEEERQLARLSSAELDREIIVVLAELSGQKPPESIEGTAVEVSGGEG